MKTAKSQISIEELENLAKQNEPMPKSLNFIEQNLYQALCFLYKRFRHGFITVEQGKVEKAQIIEQYKTNKLHADVHKKSCDLFILMGHKIKFNHDCEVCKEVYDLVNDFTLDKIQ